MKISASMKKVLLDEIEYALTKMKSNPEPSKKLFYFSAIYGCAMRIINIEFDPELAFIHHVTNLAYGQINAAIVAAGKPAAIVTIPEKVFEKLETAIGELKTKIEKNEKTYTVLEKIANIGYSTTGNGYYQYLKGNLLKD